jgi:hypothetical protein
MPIEIKELHIKAVINQGDKQIDQTSRAGSDKSAEGGSTSDKEEIIAECVEKVLAILKEKNER